MLVSTFELLIKPQLPSDVTPPLPPLDPALANLSRTVIQGYFLTISNTNKFNVEATLEFTAVTPTLDSATTATFLDRTGINRQADVLPGIPGKTNKFKIPIREHDTVLFILQPDPALLNSPIQELEVRGYVDISLSSPSSRRATLLLTPEQRGTFFKDLTAADPQLDQIIYNLPTATGGSLFKFSEAQFQEMSEDLGVLQR